MSYDLHGSWEATTGHHSVLYGRSGEVGTAASMNVVRIVKVLVDSHFLDDGFFFTKIFILKCISLPDL